MDKRPEDQVTVAMATYDKRIHHAVNVIYELLPQCDRMCVCLNGYSQIPGFLPKNNKIIYICADGKNGRPKDLGCNNKMFWCGDFPGYYATVDDDIDYPSNYIESLKNRLNTYDDNIIVSFHGSIYEENNGTINSNNRTIYQYDKKHNDYFCHRLGMGVALFNPQKIKIDKNIYLGVSKNFGDDEITAIYSQIKKIPLLCISNVQCQIIPNFNLALDNGLCVNKKSYSNRKKYLESYKQWKINLPQNKNIITIDNQYDDVTVAMASIPSRKKQMLNVVKNILPQCARLCIALNEYDNIPLELKNNKKIIAILTGKNQKNKDLGNLNKMFWCGDFPGYYATVDDDLEYYDGYIKNLKDKLKNKYNDLAICCYHGVTFDSINGKLLFDNNHKKIYFYNKIFKNDIHCIKPGMGTAMMNPMKIGISKNIYLSHNKGDSDDVLTSIFAQQHKLPCIVIGRDKIYMNSTDFAFDGLYKNNNIQLHRQHMMEEYKNWKLI